MKEHRCWAEIDTGALRHNAEVARAGSRASLIAVIKANGYGHGLAKVATALAGQADLFGVANLEEALEARTAVPQPILLLGPALPNERAEIVRQQFIPSISSAAEAAEFARLARGAPIALNCKIDTGMGRMGMAEKAALGELRAIADLPNAKIHSVSTHLPSADEDAEFTHEQLSRFAELVRAIHRTLPGAYKIHALPSAGVLGFGESAFEIVRAGLMLYGVAPQAEFQTKLRPALALKTRVVLLRDVPAGSSISYGRTFTTQRASRLATLAIGYADGLPRALSNRDASVLIRGRRCPIRGRVTMDLIIVDVSELPQVEIGDEAVLIGRQGEEEISAREMAERAGTIAWEIFTGIGSRVARVYS